MGTTIIQVDPRLPAAIRNAVARMGGASIIAELSGGVSEGFPVIKYKGKVWAIQAKGEVNLNVDENGHARPAIEVVLVRANPSLSKIYYEAAYEEGSNAPPDCYSNLGDVPDPSVVNKQARTCALCPKNVWGSKLTPQGKRTKACQDSRRVAVAFTDQVQQEGSDAPVLLLRIPPASLAPAKEYGEKVLGARGLPIFSVSTMISFEPSAAHPQFVFKAKRMLSEAEAEVVVAMRDDEQTLRILAEASDLDQNAPTGAGELSEGTEEEEGTVPGTTAPQMAQAVAPKAAAPVAAAGKPAKAAAKRPATDEEAGADLLAGLEPVQPAAKAAVPPGKPVAKANGAAPAGKPAAKAAAKPAPAVAAAEETTPDDMDSLLDSILGD